MKSITKALVLFTMSLLVGFTILHEELKKVETLNKAEFRDANEQKDEPSMRAEHSLIRFLNRGKMIASWYGPRFHGKLTANGEIYNQMALTAAHKYFKFGTLLKLTNTRSGTSVIVRINDRGPYIEGRELDLSKGAASALGILHRGVQNLKVEEVTLADANRPLFALN